MTENEAIELLKNNYPKTCKLVDGRLQGGFDDHECDVGIAIDLAIKALEEIQQYRAIGTVEECWEAMEKQKAKKPSPIDYKKYIGIVENAEYLRGTCWCPNCNQAIKSGTFCNNCGQKLDWSDEE